MNQRLPRGTFAARFLVVPMAFLLLTGLAHSDDAKRPAPQVKAPDVLKGKTVKKPAISPKPPTGASTKSPSAATKEAVKPPSRGDNGRLPRPALQNSPAPKGRTTTKLADGKSVTKAADGRVAELHDPKRNLEVRRSPDGSRRVTVERADHTRVLAERNGHGYVQHPYTYHGREYAQRSYYFRGRYYHGYYGRYEYRGVYINPYYPTYYYPAAYYSWVSYPWTAPAPYAWGWAANPWYAYYSGWFTPYPVYASASLWLTDYLIAASLADLYQAEAAALSNFAPVSPDVKQLIAGEVQRQVTLEFNEAQAAARNADPDPASSSIQRDLGDGTRHVFLAGQDLAVVAADGTECALSEGDALQMTGQAPADAQALNLTVLASKGGKECAKGNVVAVGLADLQEMQNHMRQTVDQGMQELQQKQGQGGLPAASAAARVAPTEAPMAALAPPPPPDNEVAVEINQQSQEADKAEKEAASQTGVPQSLAQATANP